MDTAQYSTVSPVRNFVVYPDHAALHWLLTISDPSGRLVRWRLRLAEYDFQIKYKTGASSAQTDALSWLATAAENILDDRLDAISAFGTPDRYDDVMNPTMCPSTVTPPCTSVRPAPERT